MVSGEVNILSLKNIGKTNIDPSLGWGNVSKLGLKEALEWRIVVESSLVEKSSDNSSDPVFVKL